MERAAVTALIIGAALLLDRALGEPRRLHPLVGFGAYADFLERHLNCGKRRRTRGILALLLAVAPWCVLAWLAQWWLRMLPPFYFAPVAAVVLYLALGRQSLVEHAGAVASALGAGDISAARVAVGRIVSRDTRALDAGGISRAAVETVLENGSDAVVASLFWFAAAGLPGVVLHRLVNTLDAMWGYRNARFYYFGWAAARCDDVLNFIPARLTAWGYVLCGRSSNAWRCWRRQARAWSSPNAGPVLAAGAGALNLMLGGAAVYDGESEQRPALGAGSEPGAGDIGRALKLLDGTLLLAVVLSAALEIGWRLWH